MKTTWTVRCVGWVLAAALALGPEALVLAETAPAASRPPAADQLFPEDTLAYVACPDVAAAKAAFWKSALGKILSEPAVKGSLAAQREAFLSFLDALLQGKAEQAGEAFGKGKGILEKTGLTWEEACGILDGPLAFGWMGAESGEGKVEARGALLAWVKDGERTREILQKAWRGILGEAPKAGEHVARRQAAGDPVYALRTPEAGFSPELTISGHWVLVTTGAPTTDAMLAAITAGSAMRPLANAPRYADCQRRLQAHGVPVVQVYLDLEALLHQGEESLKDLPDAAEAVPKVAKVLDVLGLRGARAFASVQCFDAEETVGRSVLVTEGPRAGLLKLLAGGNDPIPLAGAGKDAHQVSVARMDPAGLWDLVRQVTEAIEPSAIGHGREALRSGEQALGGVSFRDLAEALGPEVMITQGGPTGVPAVEDFVVRIQVKDSARASKAVGTLLDTLAARMQGGGMQLATQKVAGHDVRVLRGGQFPVAPCLALTKEWLMIGVTLPGITRALAGLQPGAPALAENETFKAATAKVPARGGAFAFDDLKARFPDEYARLVQSLQMAPMLAAAAGVPMPLDLKALPPVEAILPHLGPGVSRSWSDQDGLWTESRATVGGKGGVMGVAVVGGVAAGLVLRAWPSTELGKSRGEGFRRPYGVDAGQGDEAGEKSDHLETEDAQEPSAPVHAKGPKPEEIVAGLRLAAGSLATLAALGASTPSPDQSGLMPLAAVGVVAAFAIPNLLESEKAGNETSAEKCLRTLVDAEANFMKADYDNNGRDFCYNLEGLYSVCDANGNKIALIPEGLSKGSHEGYRFGPTPTYDGQGHTDRKFGFAYYAVPEVYGKTGKRSYLVNHTGAIYYKDTGGSHPPKNWPANPAAEGWTLLGE